MNKPTILIVDDEFSIRESFGLILEDSYNMLLAASGEAALKKIVDEKVHLVYLDIRMPGLDGLETLKRMKERDDSIQVIMVTAVNDVQKASQAIQFGAKDYVVKPFDVELIRNMTNKTLGRRELKEEGKKARAEGLREEIEEIIGSSGKIEEIANIIENISGKDMSILLAGEQGTEFELIAKAIHNKSERS
ncbi:MAG: response regulator, partial [Candidatus Saganbacteria bacterium]|nr:response regulator [Candidatus Saganbacteria bacterium]